MLQRPALAGPETAIRAAPRLTPGLRRGIALMSLGGAELLARISVEAADNPAIRIRPPTGGTGGRPFLPVSSADPELLAASGEGLIASILSQIARLDLPARARAIAHVLASELEPTGWLGAPLPRLARICGAGEEEVAAVLARLQRLDPAGVFARTLAECLRLQAEAEGALTPAMEAVLARLPLLAAGNVAAIAAESGQEEQAIRAAAGRLRGFDPKPGLAFSWDAPPQPPPDFVLAHTGAGWQAAPDPRAARIEIDRAGADGATRELARALERRQSTARAICEALAQRQAGWLGGGALAAVTTREIALALGLHVSTVNRVLSAMTVATPRGTIPLRALVAAPLRAGGPPAVRVRQRLAELLAQPGGTGQSDRELAVILASEGLVVARRTVAKYRAALAAGGR